MIRYDESVVDCGTLDFRDKIHGNFHKARRCRSNARGYFNRHRSLGVEQRSSSLWLDGKLAIWEYKKFGVRHLCRDPSSSDVYNGILYDNILCRCNGPFGSTWMDV